MTKAALLVLEDGSVYQGEAFGAESATSGEVVFTTSMTGYQEIITDPSFAGQIVVFTYPLIGNYGINPADFESRAPRAAGIVVREYEPEPSNWRASQSLEAFLQEHGLIGIAGIDTRALTRHLRSQGVMMGLITTETDEARALAELRSRPRYGQINLVETVSTDYGYFWETASGPQIRPRHIVVVDFGVKFNICRDLSDRGCRVTVLPWRTTAEEILSLHPDGILLSPGPGNPSLLDGPAEQIRKLLGRAPIMGICLGHQVLTQALGGRTYKLKFGHHGGNHPVKDLRTGEVRITSQNHGYAVDPDSLPAGVEISHLNLNDNTVEGITHREYPLLSIQYHSEAAPGPRENAYLFDRFLELIDRAH